MILLSYAAAGKLWIYCQNSAYSLAPLAVVVAWSEQGQFDEPVNIKESLFGAQ